MQRVRTGLFALLLCVVSYRSAQAQSADDVTAAQRQVSIAQAMRDVAQANADEAKAKLGTLDTSGLPKGTGEATSLNVEAKILAYQSVNIAATKIAAKVAALVPKPATVVIYSDKELGAVQQFRAFQQQAAVFHKAVASSAGTGASGIPSLPKLESDNTCASPTASAPVIAAEEAGGGIAPLTIVGTALQVLSLFKADKKLVGIDVDVADFALATDVAGKLIEQKIAVVYPPTFLPGAFSMKPGATASVMFKEYDALGADSTNLEAFLGLVVVRRDSINQLAATKGASASCKTTFARDVAKLGQYEAAAKTLKAAVDQQLASLIKVDDKTGTTSLQMLVAAETLATHFNAAPYVLQLKPIAAGGATLTKTNLFTTHFYFSGGAVVSYLLLDAESGNVVLAGTIPAYGGFVEAGQLSRLE